MTSYSFTKKIVCYNQSAIVQYSAVAGALHMQLKDCFRKVGSNPSTDDLKRLDELKDNLVLFLNRALLDACTKNFSFVERYYKKRGIIKPRVCVKATYDGRTLVDVSRSSGKLSSPSDLYANTATSEVMRTGRFCLIQDILKRDTYNNDRLIKSSAARYRPSKFELLKKLASLLFKGVWLDTDWLACWKNSENDDEDPVERIRSCYRSTLVIPMALDNRQLTESFRNIATGRMTELRDSDADMRYIYGFLCFDHPAAFFFHKRDDIDVGYILADLLSIFMITRLNYTTQSKTFTSVETILSKR